MTRKTAKRSRKFDKLAQSIADSLTTEQYLKLLEIAHGPVPTEIATLSDDELLAQLKE